MTHARTTIEKARTLGSIGLTAILALLGAAWGFGWLTFEPAFAFVVLLTVSLVQWLNLDIRRRRTAFASGGLARVNDATALERMEMLASLACSAAAITVGISALGVGVPLLLWVSIALLACVAAASIARRRRRKA